MEEIKEGLKIEDRFTLKTFKGRGSFGEVWLARDESTDSDVAVKIYISLDDKGVSDFQREYEIARDVHHPNLLTATYFGIWRRRPFLVMKYCMDGPVSAKAGSMDEYAIWHFIHDVSAGLRHLHGRQDPIIHQDIKPDNVLVDEEGRYLISDFGISMQLRATLRRQSRLAGNAGATAYMGPERFSSNPSPVKASDIWSLGASIYELATGQLPFEGFGGGMQKNGAELPVLGHQWSKDLNMVMRSCLAKETWDRPTARQLMEFSEAILDGRPANPTWRLPQDDDEEVLPPPPPIEPEVTDGGEGMPYPAPEPHSNTKRIWIAVAWLAALILLLFLIWPSEKQDQPSREDFIQITPLEEEEPVQEVPGDIPEIKPKGEAPAPQVEQTEPQAKPGASSTASPTAATKEASKQEAKPVDDKGARLKSALANGDYVTVQTLANQGYAPAYGPLAWHFLNVKDWSSADSYAKKAKNAGYKDGAQVIQVLQDMGYYD